MVRNLSTTPAVHNTGSNFRIRHRTIQLREKLLTTPRLPISEWQAIPSRTRGAYSARSASTGFKDDARRAGSMLAIKAHIARIAATAAKVEASDGLVP